MFLVHVVQSITMFLAPIYNKQTIWNMCCVITANMYLTNNVSTIFDWIQTIRWHKNKLDYLTFQWSS